MRTSQRNLRSRRRGVHGGGPNMTPMVDVVLVILIFFMAAMGLAVREHFIRTGAPSAAADAGRAPGPSAALPDDPLPASRAVLRLVRDDRRTLVSGLGMTRVGISEVDARLQQFAEAGAAESVIVIVAPDADVPYQDVVLVHDACARAGVANVRLGLTPGPPEVSPG
ncbi:MAG: biopolymer transporter ExbD [Phycisphaerales bacterium]|nr:MAG: biopolymer transporter ExbD [Phycisphaerales bacterium]